MKQSFKDFEIIVVDGGSTDGTLKLIEKYSVKCVIESGGLVRAYNRGWKEAKSEVTAIIDDDVMPTSTWLEEIVKTYDVADDVGAVGGPQLVIRNKQTEDFCTIEDASTPIPLTRGGLKGLLVKFFNAITMGKEGFKQGRIYGSGYMTGFMLTGSKPIEVDYINVNMSFKREALDKAGGFDENYNLGHGDYSEPDISLKIKSLGYKILYNPNILVFHEASSLGVPRNLYERARNFLYFFWKWRKKICRDAIDYLRLTLFLIIRSAFWTYWHIKTKDKRYSGYIRGLIDGYKALITNKSLR
jgi:GT2 family glycosyltransferase